MIGDRLASGGALLAAAVAGFFVVDLFLSVRGFGAAFASVFLLAVTVLFRLKERSGIGVAEVQPVTPRGQKEGRRQPPPGNRSAYGCPIPYLVRLRSDAG